MEFRVLGASRFPRPETVSICWHVPENVSLSNGNAYQWNDGYLLEILSQASIRWCLREWRSKVVDSGSSFNHRHLCEIFPAFYGEYDARDGEWNSKMWLLKWNSFERRIKCAFAWWCETFQISLKNDPLLRFNPFLQKSNDWKDTRAELAPAFTAVRVCGKRKLNSRNWNVF